MGGCSSGRGPHSTPFWRRVRRALAPRSFFGNPRRSLFGGWALPKWNVFRGGIGRKIRAGRSTVIYFRFGRTRGCITPISLHREKKRLIVFFRFFENKTAASNRASSLIIHLLCYIFALLFSLACYVVVTHIRGRVARPSAPLPTTCYGRGNSPQSRYFVFFFILEEF